MKWRARKRNRDAPRQDFPSCLSWESRDSFHAITRDLRNLLMWRWTVDREERLEGDRRRTMKDYFKSTLQRRTFLSYVTTSSRSACSWYMLRIHLELKTGHNITFYRITLKRIKAKAETTRNNVAQSVNASSSKRTSRILLDDLHVISQQIFITRESGISETFRSKEIFSS